MKDLGRVDFGSIKIHKKVLAELVISAVNDIEGVQIPPKDFLTNLAELTGLKLYPAVSVTIDQNNQVSLEVKVNVRYGLNIPEVARHVQEVIRDAIERTADIDLKDIHVNVQGIERRLKNEV